MIANIIITTPGITFSAIIITTTIITIIFTPIIFLMVEKMLKQREKLVGCLREVLWKEIEKILWEERRLRTLEGLCGRRRRGCCI